VSTDHLEDLQKDIDKLKNEGKLNENAIYRSYLQELKFRIPEKLPVAKSLIIIAIPTRLLLARFHLNGKVHEVTFPSNYCSDGLIEEDVQNVVFQQIIKKPNHGLQRAREVHLKLLAVRSGLGEYGRNNLCYVKEMGSLHRLWGFFTNCRLEDNWNEIRMMQTCKNCRACMNSCPNHCISEESFVIDAGRCVSLYNEVEGEFPEWISPKAHNALIGCMTCQSVCPANRSALATTRRLEDVTEDETRKILKGEPDQELLSSLSKKLGNIYPTRSAASFQILTRNLKALINAKSSP
jgi:epoxyqueuosine reductase